MRQAEPIKRQPGQFQTPTPFPSPYQQPSQAFHDKNQQLIEQNKRLNNYMDNKLRQDWEDLHLHNQRLQFINRHIFALQKITEELTNSLSTLQSIPSSASEQSGIPQQSKSIEGEQNRIIEVLKSNEECPPALKQELTQQIKIYHCKVTLLSSELDVSKANILFKQEEINQLEARLAQASQQNASIYNELLETTHRLKMLELAKTQNIVPSTINRPDTEPLPENQSRFVGSAVREAAFYRSEAINQDQSLQVEIKRCYEEIKSLKEQLRENKASRMDHRRSFESHKAQLQLERLLAEKKYEESQQEVKQLRNKLGKIQREQNPEFRDEANLYEDEIYHLKIKLLALQSLQVGRLCKFNTTPNLDELLDRLSPILQGSERLKDSIQLMARTYCLVAELQQKLEESESQLEKAKKRGSSYKEKYMALAKSKAHMEKQLLSSFKSKYNDYNRLIEKMQMQLQRFCQADKENELQEITQFITAPLHQKIQFANTQIAFLRKQLALKEPQSLKHQAEINNYQQRIRTLEKQNSNLLKSNREAQKQLLEQQLSSAVSKSKQHNQNKVDQRKSNMMNPSTQLAVLQQQVAVLHSQLQESNDLLVKEKNKNDHIMHLKQNQEQQLNQIKLEFESLRNRNNTEFNSTQSNEKQGQELQAMRNENISNRRKIEELQKIIEQRQNQFQRVEEQKGVIIQRLEKIEQQFESLSGLPGQDGSLKRFESISSRIGGYEEEIAKLQNEITQKSEEIRAKRQELTLLQRECSSFEEDNLKLMFTLKEHNISVEDLNMPDLCSDRWQRESTRHLEQKVRDLTEDNQVLKNLIDELRQKVINSKNNEGPIIELKNALATAQNEADQYKEELQYVRQKQEAQRERLQKDWEKLVLELNAISSELERYKRGGVDPRRSDFSEQSERSYLVSEDIKEGRIVKSEIIDLMGQLEIKNQLIRQLREQIRRDRNRDTLSQGIQTDAIYSEAGENEASFARERQQLREQNQRLRQANYGINQKLRTLQNQYNSFRLHMISSSSSLPKINFASAPYIEGQKINSRPLAPINDLYSSQSERSSHAGRQDIVSRKSESLRNYGITGSEPGLIGENQKGLDNLAPLVESVREGYD